MPEVNLNIDPTIYCWKITEPETELKARVNLSSIEEKLIFSHKSKKRRKEMLSARVLLATVIPNEHIHYHNKKPFLVYSNKEISISNSGDLVVIQLKDENKLAGVDVQFFSKTIIRVKHKFLHKTEFKLIGTNELRDLSILWSTKETLYKAYSEEKLEFKKQLVITDINLDKKIIAGIIDRDNVIEKFKVSALINEDFVMTWI